LSHAWRNRRHLLNETGLITRIRSASTPFPRVASRQPILNVIRPKLLNDEADSSFRGRESRSGGEVFHDLRYSSAVAGFEPKSSTMELPTEKYNKIKYLKFHLNGG
jgi:hypothetical protein